MDDAAAEILRFWIEEVGPEGWYKVDPALDDLMRLPDLAPARAAIGQLLYGLAYVHEQGWVHGRRR